MGVRRAVPADLVALVALHQRFCAADGHAFDAGRARIYGLEASVNADLPIQGALRAPFLLAYTYTRAEFLALLKQ